MGRYTLQQSWEILKMYFQNGEFSSETKKIIFSDEAHFYLGGYANKQYCSIWGTKKPYVTVENPQRYHWNIFL